MSFSTFVFVAEAENFQAFYKVISDLHAKNDKNVHVVYFGQTPDDLMFVADLEFWARTPGWTVSLMVVSPTPEWQYLVGRPEQATAFTKIPTPTASTGVFFSVYPVTRAPVCGRFETKGYRANQMHWVN